MRTAVLVAALLATGIAFADNEFTMKPDRIEMKKGVVDNGDTGDDGTDSATRAQDYNSSRSNTTSARKGDVDKRAKKLKPKPRLSSAASKPGSPNSGATRAQDYNSSRSNTTSAIELDTDSDGDSIDARTCKPGNNIDNDCDDRSAPVAPLTPANHNTTRSNRTIN